MNRTEYNFWIKVDKTDSCWNWTGFRDHQGYGKFSVSTDGVKRCWLAHRFAVRHTTPEGMDVLHTCDNRRCVNPAHLFFGTHQDNMTDHVVKGRHVLKDGEDHPWSKLTTEQVVIIKARPRKYGVVKRLCSAFGVSRHTLYAIDSGVSWDHVPPPTDEDRLRAKEFVDSLP